MDLNSLRDLLRQQANTTNSLELSEAKLTSIDNNLLPPDNLGDLISQSLNFPEKTIIIKSISASDITDLNDRNELIITKGVVTWFEKELPVKYLKFTVKNTNPQPTLSFVLQIALGENWTLGNHFPMLEGFSSNEVKLSNCNYIFSTDDQTEFTWNLENNQDTISLQSGLNFVSHFEVVSLSLLTNFLTFTKANSSLKDFTLFGKIIPNACNCTVDVDESTSLSEIIYFPIFDFKTPLITRDCLNYFSVLKITAPTLGISAEEVDAETYDDYYPQIYLGLNLLKQDNTPPSLDTLDIYATFIPNSSFLKLIVLPQELSVKDLRSFIPIINDIWNKNNNYIPPFVQNILDKIELQSHKIELQSLSTTVFLGDGDKISSCNCNIADINATIGTKNWELFDGFTIDSLSVSWSCLNPTNPEYKHHMVCFLAQFTIHEITFEVEISTEQIISGIAQGEMSLNHLLENTFKDAKLPIPFEIVFNEFEIYMDVPKKEYYFSAQAYVDLDILDGKSLIMNDTRFEIGVSSTTGENNVSSPNKTYSASIQGYLQLAGAYVYLNSNYSKNNSSSGWYFQGSTEDGQEILIGDLIKDITHLFGDVTLPSAIEGLTIQKLGISFNTNSKNFTFTCESKFPINNQQVDITVDINIIQQLDGSYKKHFDGHITIGSLKFALIFDTDQTSTKFLAAYHDDQTIKIKDLIGDIDDKLKDDIPEGLEINLKDALFVYYKQQTLTNFLVGLNIGGGINLSNLPLVGQEFPPSETVKFSLQVLVTKADFTAPELQTFNTLYTDGGIQLPTTDINERLNLIPSIQFGSEILQLELPITINKQTGQIQDSPSSSNNTSSLVTPSATPTTIDDGTKWFQLQKALGPVHFQRVGLKYQDSKIWVLLDASLNLAGLSLSLDGLAVNSPLNQFDPKFDLKGIGIDYKGSDTLEIGGAFLRTTQNGIDEYNGAAVIKFNVKGKALKLSAIGSYAYFEGHPSLFIYALLDYPIGGPSFFFVTGLAAGFGYNRALKVPTIDQVATFPLVAEAVNPPPAAGSNLDKAARLTGELTKLRDYIPPETGQIFLAIGVKFNSFKTIDAFVLLTIAFGNRFELNVLGLATLIAPANVGAGVPPVAQVQLAIKASFLPAEGFIGVIAQLTPNSYILSQACHLTGGFAFYGWFVPNVHEGDFVLTLGGYHPLFKVPDHYPKVPRLILNWQVNSELYIKADAYFALTPSAIMAGGHLQATWNSGPLSAWFNAGADFLMSWKPYHYDISIYVDMGVSYTFHFFGTHHITVQLGADLHIWGPEFTGIAHIHLWIISFDVRFGSSASQSPKAIDWNEFKTSFLPAADAICSITVQEGLVRKVNQDDKTDLGIINPKDFCLVTNSVIPIKTCKQLNTDKINDKFGISPMEVKSEQLTSDLTISITRDGKSLSSAEFDENFTCIPLFKKVPIALWGESLTPSLNGNQFLENTLSGLEINPKKQPDTGAKQAINRSELQFSTTLINNAYHWQTISTFQEEPTKDISSTIVDNAVKNARDNLLTALNLNSEEIDISATIADIFLVSPKIGVLVN